MTAPTEDLIARLDMIADQLMGLPQVTATTREAAQALRALQQEVERLRSDIEFLDAERNRDGARPQHIVRAIAVVAANSSARSALTGSAPE